MRTDHPDRQGGFSLVELLVVMIFVGILAAITIPSYLSHVDRAREAAVRTDLASAAITMESYFVAERTYSTAALLGFRTSDGVSITVEREGTSFCLQGSHTAVTEHWTWDNARGGQQTAGTPCG
jgi:prepilin-type N-terminal cleavage/methylation domain-containing protein